MKKNILVTGGCGFIGKHLVKRLLQQKGYRVTVIDVVDLLEGMKCRRSNMEFIRVNLKEMQRFEDILLDRRIDTVCHLAWATIPGISIQNPLSEIRENLNVTIRLLEACRLAATKRFIFLSSGGTVYGDPNHHPTPETHPTNPISAYGIAKLTVEKYLQLYNKLYGLEYIVFRPSTPYGPGQSFRGKQGAVSVFLFRALTGKSITVWGDGSVTRDYFFIDDLIEALLRGIKLPGATDLVMNLGGKEMVSLSQLIEKIQALLGVKVEVRYKKSRPFDVRSVKLDCQLALDKIGWEATVDLNQGMKQTAAWIRKRLDRPKGPQQALKFFEDYGFIKY